MSGSRDVTIRDAAAYERIAAVVSAAGGLQLTDYRRSTVLRRVLRRMRRMGSFELDDYLDRLERDPEEAAALSRELRVSRSTLFSDPETYASLLRTLPALLSASTRPQIWVPVCGSGEETYAIAALVSEVLAAGEAPDEFLVFGTDSDDESLAEARSTLLAAGIYECLPPHLRQRHLRAEAGITAGADGLRYRVDAALAAHCIFLAHDPAASPPFSGLDLIVCRNPLSVLEAPAQRRLLESFHRALRPGGLLLAGRSESLASHHDLFQRHGANPGVYSSGPAPLLAPRLLRAGREYRALFEQASLPMTLADGAGRILEVNAAFAGLAGEPAAHFPGLPLSALLAEDGAQALAQLWPSLAESAQLDFASSLALPGGSEPATLRLQRLGGALGEVLVEWRRATDAAPVDALPRQPMMTAALGLMSDGLIATDARGAVTEINLAAERLTGWPRAEALGQPHDRVLRLLNANGTLQAGLIDACLRAQQPSTPSEHHLLSRDGRRMKVRARCAPLASDARRQGALILLQDTTELGLLTEELAYRSSHDAVTGLLSRDEFERRLNAALAEARADGSEHLLCYVDLDQFKVINDTLGHYAGDELLRHLSSVFRDRLRPQDALARLGGDEFGVLLKDTSPEQGKPIVDALMEAARSFRFLWESESYALTISIGVALLEASSAGVGRVLSLADAACYAAKDAGRDRARWASADDADIHHRHGEMSLVGKIGKALDEDLFVLHYEDVVEATEPTRVVYREILVRMRDEDGRLVQPASFIAAAERYYLMTALDRWVMSNAFARIAQLPADGIVYAVNVSGLSLTDENFQRHVLQCLSDTGLAPERLCFEITETAAISHLSEAVRFMERMAALGCRFALDDFGAGMASFSYLKNLPVQFLKIDGGFVRTMQASRFDHGMVEAINRIGHEMGLRTIAEHVEDSSLLAPLAAMGVDWVQGRAIGRSRCFDELLPPAA